MYGYGTLSWVIVIRIIRIHASIHRRMQQPCNKGVVIIYSIVWFNCNYPNFSEYHCNLVYMVAADGRTLCIVLFYAIAFFFLIGSDLGYFGSSGRDTVCYFSTSYFNIYDVSFIGVSLWFPRPVQVSFFFLFYTHKSAFIFLYIVLKIKQKNPQKKGSLTF